MANMLSGIQLFMKEREKEEKANILNSQICVHIQGKLLHLTEIPQYLLIYNRLKLLILFL